MTDYMIVNGEPVPMADAELAELRKMQNKMTAALAPVPTLSREAFCVALIGAGILTQAEAEAAALGDWPPKFEPALEGKDLVAKLTAKNTWRTIKVVPRDAPLFLDLLAFYAAAAGLPAAQAQALGDQIFAGASNG